jgi:pyrroline-5-carboxylate reductase
MSSAIAFIGAGNMASALMAGLQKTGTTMHALDPNAQQREAIHARFGIAVHASLDTLDFKIIDKIVLAVKPQQMPEVVRALGTALSQAQAAPLIISVAAGIRVADIARWLASGLGGVSTAPRIVRTMPNTPALVGAGITGMFANSNCQENDKTQAQNLMQAGGQTVWVDREEQLDAVTAVSGSGPAYVFYFIEALLAAGEREGLSSEQSRQLAIATFTGAAKLAAESTESPAVLRERVTSKGGTTYAALNVMREAKLDEIIFGAVHAAKLRAAELGDEFGQNQ